MAHAGLVVAAVLACVGVCLLRRALLTWQLGWAVSQRDPATVRELLRRGASPRWRSGGGHSGLLGLAARHGDPETLRLLLAAGADPNPPGGERPLAAAAQWQGEPHVSILLEHGARVSSAREWNYLLWLAVGGRMVQRASAGLPTPAPQAAAPRPSGLELRPPRPSPHAVPDDPSEEVERRLLEGARRLLRERPGDELSPNLVAFAVRSRDLTMAKLLLDHGAPVEGLPPERRGELLAAMTARDLRAAIALCGTSDGVRPEAGEADLEGR